MSSVLSALCLGKLEDLFNVKDVFLHIQTHGAAFVGKRLEKLVTYTEVK